MLLLGLIIGGIVLCLIFAVIWFFIDYRKFKKRNVLTLFMVISAPFSLYAQYGEGGRYTITFADTNTKEEGLERKVNDLSFHFIPGTYAWGVTVHNQSGESVFIDWKNAQFIVNGRASGVILDTTSSSIMVGSMSGTNVLSMSISPAILYTGDRPGRILGAGDFANEGGKSVLIVLPVAQAGGVKQYYSFGFIIKERKRPHEAYRRSNQ